MTDKSIQPFEAQCISANSLDLVRTGQWYWVKVMPDEVPDGVFEDDFDRWKYNEKYAVEEPYCVEHVGSNHIEFTRNVANGSTGFRLHFDNFDRCRPFENWEEHFKGRMAQIQIEMGEAMQKMLVEGQNLCLIPQDASVEEDEQDADNLLPAVATNSPERYKTSLVAFRDERMPVLQKQVDELAEEFAVTAKHVYLPTLVKMGEAKKALAVVEDRIFTVELYCGLLETVHTIKDGETAPMDTPISIRQQLLYMDEETLFDYADGGMDFEKLEQFDEWVVKPENLKRIMPEPKGVVAFRVRREAKDYGGSKSLLDAWIQMEWHKANKQTYLLIRNGEKVYRIATDINFSPRLVPFEDEIGEAQFKKIHKKWRYKPDPNDPDCPFGEREEWTEEESITPDHLEYDESVADVESKLKHYNRMIILIQGLLDRSAVFIPHPGIKLTRDDHMGKWLKCIRDEEKALPSNKVTWEEYRDQVNKSIRKGKKVFSTWKDESIPWETKRYNSRDWDLYNRPQITEVVQVKRDKSAVKVRWMKSAYARGRNDEWGDWMPGHDYERGVTTWIPMDEVFNLTDYNLDDYKMFLCDRALKGQYLKWAPAILTAEDMARLKAGRVPKEPRSGWKKKVELMGGELMTIYEKMNPTMPGQEDEE